MPLRGLGGFTSFSVSSKQNAFMLIMIGGKIKVRMCETTSPNELRM
jgi:hypothetical protein